MEDQIFERGAFGVEGVDPAVVVLEDEAETRAFGALLAGLARAGDFFGLVGDLGAGKTTLVQGFVERLGSHDPVTSPTYTLLHEYVGHLPVVHIDLYRVESYDEVESTGYWDYVEAPTTVTLVEWIGRVRQAWPGGAQSAVVRLMHHRGMRRAEVYWSSRQEQLRRAVSLWEFDRPSRGSAMQVEHRTSPDRGDGSA